MHVPHRNTMKTTVGSTAELMVSDTVWMTASNICCMSAHLVHIITVTRVREREGGDTVCNLCRPVQCDPMIYM